MNFYGIIFGWEMIGGLGVGEAMPIGIVSSANDEQPCGLYREACGCVEVVDKCAHNW